LAENKGDEWYAQHIPTAAKILSEVVAGTPLQEQLAPYLKQAIKSC
jgi:hypothetical protein